MSKVVSGFDHAHLNNGTFGGYHPNDEQRHSEMNEGGGMSGGNAPHMGTGPDVTVEADPKQIYETSQFMGYQDGSQKGGVRADRVNPSADDTKNAQRPEMRIPQGPAPAYATDSRGRSIAGRIMPAHQPSSADVSASLNKPVNYHAIENSTGTESTFTGAQPNGADRRNTNPAKIDSFIAEHGSVGDVSAQEANTGRTLDVGDQATRLAVDQDHGTGASPNYTGNQYPGSTSDLAPTKKVK